MIILYVPFDGEIDYQKHLDDWLAAWSDKDVVVMRYNQQLPRVAKGTKVEKLYVVAHGLDQWESNYFVYSHAEGDRSCLTIQEVAHRVMKDFVPIHHLIDCIGLCFCTPSWMSASVAKQFNDELVLFDDITIEHYSGLVVGPREDKVALTVIDEEGAERVTDDVAFTSKRSFMAHHRGARALSPYRPCPVSFFQSDDKGAFSTYFRTKTVEEQLREERERALDDMFECPF